mmetsp:Transcript_34758/g.99825  ORF Transcript_34758/g.99825 Transcript_34758/m.99825 type:complete len:124 (+) Transcript_34758:489-860(+)
MSLLPPGLARRGCSLEVGTAFQRRRGRRRWLWLLLWLATGNGSREVIAVCRRRWRLPLRLATRRGCLCFYAVHWLGRWGLLWLATGNCRLDIGIAILCGRRLLPSLETGCGSTGVGAVCWLRL